jgi:hypothetical protein
VALASSALLALSATVAPTPAGAFTMLNGNQRQQILRNADLAGPDGKKITDPACIEGRLSTVDPRWAMAFLTNTKSCVRRYGGASGESTLLKRSSERATDWRAVGNVSETCSPHEAGATDAVLRDLGCAFFERQRLRPVDGCSNAGTGNDLFLADITTRHVSCPVARRFIVALHAARPDFKTEITHYRAFTCTPSAEGVAVWVRCVEGRELIRWLNGT